MVKEALETFTKGKFLIHLFRWLILTKCNFIFGRFYKNTGEIVAIKMIDLEAELLHDEHDAALTAISQEIEFMLEC